MNFTGERWVFQEGGNDLIQREHMARYEFATSYVQGLKVLDIACGVGYGSLLLHRDGKAKEVVGADIDDASIDHATQVYATKGLSYTHGDAQAMPFEDASFDVVVSFETIEHLPDQQQYLAEVYRVLKPGGSFLVSTPDKDMYRLYNLGKPNKFHVKELSRSEFSETLKVAKFSVKLFAQNQIEPQDWESHVGKGSTKSLLRKLDVFGIRKIVKQLLSRGINYDVSEKDSLYDRLDPHVSPADPKKSYVYLMAVCKKGKA